MKFFSGLTAFLFAVLVILFAMSNPDSVTLRIWPVPYELEAPAFLIALAGAALGVIWGGFAAWGAGVKARMRLRRAEVRTEAALRDVRRLESVLDTYSGPPADKDGEGGAALPARVS